MMFLSWTDPFWEVGWLHRFVLLLHNHSFQTRVWQKEPLLQPHWCKFWAGKTFTTLSGLVKQKQPIQSQGNCKKICQMFLCFKAINCNYKRPNPIQSSIAMIFFRSTQTVHWRAVWCLRRRFNGAAAFSKWTIMMEGCWRWMQVMEKRKIGYWHKRKVQKRRGN